MLSQEFQDQTVKEETLGVEVTQMLKYKDKVTFFNGQSFFSSTLNNPISFRGACFPAMEEYWNLIWIAYGTAQRDWDQPQDNRKRKGQMHKATMITYISIIYVHIW